MDAPQHRVMQRQIERRLLNPRRIASQCFSYPIKLVVV
jgi:hypothetical protein